jgi:hypothetical protein
MDSKGGGSLTILIFYFMFGKITTFLLVLSFGLF